MGRICQRAQRAAAGVRVLSALTASACMAVMTGVEHATQFGWRRPGERLGAEDQTR